MKMFWTTEVTHVYSAWRLNIPRGTIFTTFKKI